MRIINNIFFQHLISRVMGFFANCRFFPATLAKHWFAHHYNVNLDEAEYNRLKDYPTFNAFFTRRLKDRVRPIYGDDNTFVSPVDGILSQWGDINDGNLIQAKGIHYRLDALLAGNTKWTDVFAQAKFATLYLSPRHYHRVHMPLNGKLESMAYVPGNLFSVNQKRAEKIPNLFTRNERMISIFSTELGPMAVIMVGAVIVAGISTVWSGKLKARIKIDYRHYDDVTLKRGAELGYFELGSTVIVLIANSKLQWQAALKENQEIKFGGMLLRLDEKESKIAPSA
ncbi:MAG: archaetidylserine decarboxylase [Pseudomonadota bacterium]